MEQNFKSWHVYVCHVKLSNDFISHLLDIIGPLFDNKMMLSMYSTIAR